MVVCAEHLNAETVQLNTFREEKKQKKNTEQKTPSNLSDTQVVVDASARVCNSSVYCPRCAILPACMTVDLALQTCFSSLFCPAPQNTFLVLFAGRLMHA